MYGWQRSLRRRSSNMSCQAILGYLKFHEQGTLLTHFRIECSAGQSYVYIRLHRLHRLHVLALVGRHTPYLHTHTDQYRFLEILWYNLPKKHTSDTTLSCQHTMTVQGPDGMTRLQQLVNFGRYGADYKHNNSQDAEVTMSSSRSRLSNFRQIASSLSGFYSWVSRQAGHKVTLPKRDVRRAAALTTKQKVSNADVCNGWHGMSHQAQ